MEYSVACRECRSAGSTWSKECTYLVLRSYVEEKDECKELESAVETQDDSM